MAQSLLRKILQRISFAILGSIAAANSTSALAQIANSTPPSVITPLSSEPDHNAVNITDGKIRISTPVLAIPAAPRLRLDAVQDAQPYLSAKLGGTPVESSVSTHIGGSSSESFSCTNDDVCINHQGRGGTLEAVPYIHLIGLALTPARLKVVKCSITRQPQHILTEKR
jgi:hypothetical protein